MMCPRHVSLLLFIIAIFVCCLEAAVIRPVFGKIAFGCFGLICLCGIVIRWGPLIPATLIAFLIGQMLPEKHGYTHNAWESIEHDLLDPTLIAAFVAVLMICSGWGSKTQVKADGDD